MHFKCHRNLSIATRMRLECSRNVPIGPRMSPDVHVIQNTAESHIQEYTKKFHSDGIPAHSASFRLYIVWLGFEIPSQMWHKFWKIFSPAESAWFLLILNKCDRAYTIETIIHISIYRTICKEKRKKKKSSIFFFYIAVCIRSSSTL